MAEEAEHLLLKWGTLNGWAVAKNDGALAALKRYHEHPVAMGAMWQRDTPEQKQAICDLIDAINGEIHNDWTGEVMSKEDAKKYVLDYGQRENSRMRPDRTPPGYQA